MTDAHGTAAFTHYQQFLLCFKSQCTSDSSWSKQSFLDNNNLTSEDRVDFFAVKKLFVNQ